MPPVSSIKHIAQQAPKPVTLSFTVEDTRLHSRLGPIAWKRRKSQYHTAVVRDLPSADIPSHPSISASSTQTGLERIPTASLLRNLLLGTFFTRPLLFKAGFTVLNKIASSESRLLNPDKNRLLRAVIKPLVYDQFCAGTNHGEITRTKDTIRGMGYSGIILCYGKEVAPPDSCDSSTSAADRDALARTKQIAEWRDGNLQTLDMVSEGDWLGIKFTGAGEVVTNDLICNREPSSDFVAAMDSICAKARSKNCRLWIDSEQQAVQQSIDKWTIDLMRKYNRDGTALVHNTLQAYLKASRTKLKHQLALADKEGWTLAIKLVRGAYIASDPREVIHDTKKDTDDSYNDIAQDLLSGSNLGFEPAQFPKMQLFLAGHNPESVSRALSLVQSLSEQGKLKVIPDFGQLQGMADELGCKVLQQCDQMNAQQKSDLVIPKVYKCLTWGTIQQCMLYMIRRAVENKGGADRMKDGMAAYYGELKRRLLRRA